MKVILDKCLQRGDFAWGRRGGGGEEEMEGLRLQWEVKDQRVVGAL